MRTAQYKLFLNIKSDKKVDEKMADSYLEGAANKIEERRGDLVLRQRFLQDKITTMERSIPALMAYNMWMAGQKCEDAPLCKVREIMSRFSPLPDPTEKLVSDLESTVKKLDKETEELHEKIIAADVQLEEGGMELESLEMTNKELKEKADNLEHEIRKNCVPSLHSIHSEDLVSLTKIIQLGQEELDRKCCIKELEEKEILFREQMDRLLSSREFQQAAGGKKMAKRIRELETNEKKMNCALQTHKYNMHQLKKKLLQREKEGTGTIQTAATAGTSHGKSDITDLTDVSNGVHLPNTYVTSKYDNKETIKIGNESRILSGRWNSKKHENLTNSAMKLNHQSRANNDIPFKSCICPTPLSIPCNQNPNCLNAPKSSAIYDCDPLSNRIPKCGKLSPNNSSPCTITMTPYQCAPRSCCIPLHSTIQGRSHCKPCISKSSRIPGTSKFTSSLRRTSGGGCCTYNIQPESPVDTKSTNFCPPKKITNTSTMNCESNPLCESLPCAKDINYCPPGKSVSSKKRTPCIQAPCILDPTYPKCQAPTPCKECLPIREFGGCRCSCKGRCARGESDVPCNCSMGSNSPNDKGYQPRGYGKTVENHCNKYLQQGNSDSDEFCACCDCGCNDSQDSEHCECK
ncbi:uncharacterized protein LOC107271430 isoform X3 [Cephus cinctus]|uniref:Uncharacterized protein LOC107271430 isoform X3 n=1 Tax=Cephus cinctus TaxID=211228 RepID=A0AAJ7RPZ0_CEPCN|nr:uncharacterized protein LOC107271430 isoform X3 [Cephus cinctus]